MLAHRYGDYFSIQARVLETNVNSGNKRGAWRSGLQKSRISKLHGYTCLLKWNRRDHRSTSFSQQFIIHADKDQIMKRRSMVVMAATLALFATNASFARNGGGMGGAGNQGQRAPSTALQNSDMTKDQVQIKDPLQTRDPLATQDQLKTQDRTYDRDRSHQQKSASGVEQGNQP